MPGGCRGGGFIGGTDCGGCVADATGGDDTGGDDGLARGAVYEGSAALESSSALPPQASALDSSPSPTARHARTILIHRMPVILE